MLIQAQTGPQTLQDGTYPNLRAGKAGDAIISELNGRYYENTYRGNKYAASVGGAGQTLVAANLFSTAIGTFQPIMALYNPLTNNKNFVIAQAWCGITQSTLLTPTQAGGFFWVGNAAQAISNAASVTPINCLTLKQTGSTAIPVLNAVLTGAVGTQILIRPISSSIQLVTATANATGQAVDFVMEEVAGSLVVPPGGYVGFANGISSTTGVVNAGMVWDELPI
jgi:hypothetical protein